MEKKETSLNESIIKIRVKLQETNLKKSGKNKFAGFDYFELADFLPTLNKLMLEEGVNDKFYIKDNLATLEIQKGEEVNVYTMPFVLFETPVNIKTDSKTGEVREVKSMQDIQYLGALNTYYKRYLYLNAFGITDGEVIDSMNNEDLGKKTTKKAAPKVEPKKETTAREDLIAWCNVYNLNINEVSQMYNLTRNSTDEEFRQALNTLKGNIE